MTRQCLRGRRFGTAEEMRSETSAWQQRTNDKQRGVEWQFHIDDAASADQKEGQCSRRGWIVHGTNNAVGTIKPRIAFIQVDGPISPVGEKGFARPLPGQGLRQVGSCVSVLY
jgi:hypothetical protein